MASKSTNSPGRRRSSRLIASPWVFNWPKKPAVFVNLGVDETSNSKHELDGKTKSGKIKVGLGVENPPGAVDRLDVRNEMLESEEDDDFMTPAEKFSNSGSKRPARIQMGSGNSAIMCTSVREKKARLSRSVLNASEANVGKQTDTEEADAHAEDTTADGVAKTSKKLARPGEVVRKNEKGKQCLTKRGKAEAQQPVEVDDKPKKTRTYNRYLQKKFTPAIITDMIANLSEAQSNWVKKAGFEHVLRHRNRIFPHRIAYNVVEAFDSDKCALVLQAGTVYITESLVHNVLGLPQGDSEIKLSKSRIAKCDWDEQYDTTQITPTMIKDKILESPRADYNFKMNFLILMYNFFIEANQNGYVKRDFLSFRGNIDNCGTYNWCSLVLRKLRVTHEFWADAKWRNFAGPLPCLIFSYVCCVQSTEGVHPANTIPWYQGWSDNMLRDREKHEEGTGSFGVGVLTSTSGKINEVAGSGGVGVDMTMRDLVVPDSLSGGEDADARAVCGTEKWGVRNDEEGSDGIDATLDGINDNIEYIIEELEELRHAEDMNEALDTSNKVDFNKSPIHMEGLTEKRNIDLSSKGSAAPTGNNKKVVMSAENAGYPSAGNIEGQGAGQLQFGDLGDHGVHDNPNGGQIEEARADVETTQKAEARKTAGHGVKKIKVVLAADRVGHDSPGGVMSTQARADLEIDNHFDEEPYMKRFEENMLELEASFNKCLANYIESMALYPENEKLAELRTRYKHFFQLFVDSSPITKSLSKRCANQGRKTTVDADDNSSCPSFSLGMSQMFPQNLGDVMDNCAVTPVATKIVNSEQHDSGNLQPPVKYGPMLMNVAKGDVDATLNRYAAFDDNMEVVLKLVNEIHGRMFDVNDFEMVKF
ncbi:hypothetical protein ACET3Z_028845 [Daucus carota]